MPSMDLTPEEARYIMKRRRSFAKDEVFRQGLNAAADEVLKWDGAIECEATRVKIAMAIRRLKRPRKIKVPR